VGLLGHFETNGSEFLEIEVPVKREAHFAHVSPQAPSCPHVTRDAARSRKLCQGYKRSYFALTPIRSLVDAEEGFERSGQVGNVGDTRPSREPLPISETTT
jgi:hypothetical protein